jgi:hypothetical protein
MGEKEVEAVKRVIEEAYMDGIHRTQDRETVESGFHRDFRMLVLNDDKLQKVSLDEWFRRIEGMKAENPEMWKGESRHEFHLVDVVGKAAVAKLDVYKNDEYFSTDYMLLYRFGDGWRIVSKVFTT